MLDIFRKHATSWLIKVALFFIAIVFIFWGGYSYKSQQETQVARVGDHYISNAEYNQSYNQLVSMYRRQMGQLFSEEILQQFNVKKQALDLLVDRFVLVKAGQELGIAASDQEVQQQILEYPVFQADGRFDQNRYVQILQQNRLSPEAFERQIAEDLTIRKIESFIKRRAVVTEEEIQADFQFNHNRIQVAYAILDPKSYEDQVAVTEEALQSFYQSNQGRYQDPERRQITHVVFKPEDYLGEVQIGEEEIRDRYADNSEAYRHEQEVKARHILFSVKEDAPQEEVSKVEAEARAVLDQARQGKDFTELAKQYSQDPSAKENAGDLGYFTRDIMTPAFSEAAFALKPGEISDLVRTPFGFHIIKVDDVRPERTIPLEEVKGQIEEELKREKARDVAYNKAKNFSDNAYAQREVEEAAKAQNLTVTSTLTGITEGELLPGVEGADPELMGKLFKLQEKEISDVLEMSQGFMVAQIQAIQPPQTLPLDKVRDRVEKDFRADQARSLAQRKATELLETARKGAGLEDAAKAMQVTARKSDWFSRREPENELKLLRGEAQNKLFQLQEAQPWPESPLELGGRYVVVQLLGKQGPVETLDKERDTIQRRLLQEKQDQVWQAWLEERRTQTPVEVFREL